MITSAPQVIRAGFARTVLAVLTACCLVCLSGFLAPAAAVAQTVNAEPKYNFDVPAGDAKPMLRQFAAQSKREIVIGVKEVEGIKTNAVKGELTAQEAVDQMLANTGLVASKDEKTGAFAVRKETPVEAKNVSSRPEASDRAAQVTEDGAIKLETFEVFGQKTLNMDVPRSRDDAQPYVVFDRERIAQAGPITLEDFLRTRLPMNTMGPASTQVGNINGTMSSINLRGLGSNQTLILVDGRRLSQTSIGGNINQPNLNGIPINAIERIEVLPTTASGIYGGNATGGVINIILRRNYSGASVGASYENTFKTDSAIKRIDFSGSISTQDGRTNLQVRASHSEQNRLLVQDRDFLSRGRAIIAANNFAAFRNSSTPLIGSTANIRSSNGTNLVLKNGTPLNSPITFAPNGYQGGASDSGAALVANAGKYNLDVPSSAAGGGGLATLVNAPTIDTANLSFRHRVTKHVELFAEVDAANMVGEFSSSIANTGGFTVPASSPTNPFLQNIRVATPLPAPDLVISTENQTRRATAGAVIDLPREWKAEADIAWSGSRYDNTSPPNLLFTAVSAGFASGALDLLRDPRQFPTNIGPFLDAPTVTDPYKAHSLESTIRAGGPIWKLNGNPVVASMSLDWYQQKFNEQQTHDSSSTTIIPARSQDNQSAYAEVKLPIFTAANSVVWARELEFQLAGRYDEFSTHGATNFTFIGDTSPVSQATNRVSSTNPTLGLRFQPIQDITLRGSYGTGFLPPDVTQLVSDAPALAAGFGALTDPRRGNELVGTFTQLSGGNPNLQPEKSKNQSLGLILTPRIIPQLRISVDWTKITKSNNIISPSLQGVIDNEAFLPGRIVRGAPAPGDPFSVGQITQIDTTRLNITHAEVQAFDFQLDYEQSLGSAGKARLFAVASRQTHLLTQAAIGAPFVESAGVINSGAVVPVTLRWKGTAGLSWEFGDFTSGISANYFDSYRTNVASQVLSLGNGGIIPSQTYFDAFVTYKFHQSGRWHRVLSGLTVTVGARNVFNREPPFDPSFTGSLYSGQADPRLAVYYLSMRKDF